jgi:alkylated DNA repair dioxygenase AlkB
MELALKSQGSSFRIDRDSLDIEFWSDFLAPSRADDLLSTLLTETPWVHGEIAIYGKKVKMPRLTAWYGDPGAVYTYSGLRNEPLPWSAALSEIRADVESFAEHTFNSVLLNYYRNGDDYMSWHRDDEPELGPRPVIASVTLGAARRFQFREARPAEAGKRKTHEIELTHWSLLVMRGDTQRVWEHGIPKAKGVVEPRINLTFRRVGPWERSR